MSVDKRKQRVDSDISQRDLQTIKERDTMIQDKYERISGNKIYLKQNRFVCENCGSKTLNRSSQHGRHTTPRFTCRVCGKHSKFVYDTKTGKSVAFDEYAEIMNQIKYNE